MAITLGIGSQLGGADWGPDPDAPEVLTFEIGDIKCHVDLQDIDGFLVEQVTPEGPAASIRIKCLWTKRWDLVAALMGKNYLKNNVITRDLPFEYPAVKGIFCTSIPEIRGIKPYRDDSGDFAGAPGWMAFRYAVLTCNFSKPPYQLKIDDSPEDNDLSDLPFITTTLKVSSETLNAPGGTYYLADGQFKGQPIQDVTAGLIYNRFEITMRRWFMPVVPVWDIGGAIGRVNEDQFDLTVAYFGPGQVLFMGVELEQVADPSTGIILWNIDYKFLANWNNEWNTVLDRDGKWQLITTSPDGKGNVPFPSADLNALLLNTVATGPPGDPGEEPV